MTKRQKELGQKSTWTGWPNNYHELRKRAPEM